jgi:Cellulase (glycosyl hydrolase family 5)
MGFSISNGQIIGPTGQPFTAKGIAVLDSEMSTTSAASIISQFPGINSINLAVGADGNGYATAQSNAAIIAWVNDATSKGLVVTLSDYVPGQPQARSGADLQASLNWYASLAKAFANNPNVWWTTENEVGGNLAPEEQGIYNAIRGAGNNGLIFMEAQDGNATTTNGLDPSIYANMTNVGWNIHAYPWEFNTSSTNQADYDNTLKNDVALFQNFAQSANGVMPVLMGEGGNSTSGNGVAPDDPIVNGKFAVTQAILDDAGASGGTTGYLMWLHDWHGQAGDSDTLVNISNNTLTDFGAQVAAAIAAGGGSGNGSGSGSTGSSSGGNPSASPSGTTIKAASSAPIIDQNGNAWSLVQSASNGLQIAVNGTVDAPTANVVLLETLKGAMIQESSGGTWYSETAPNDSWTQIANPNPKPPPTPSPSGTSITAASASPIIDQTGNAWTLVQSASNGLQVAVNGTVDAPTANVVLLETLKGAMIQENSSGNWYSETTPNDSWAQIANPAPVVSAITTSPGGGDLTVGATVTLTATFNSAVTVAGGTPTLALNDGGVATYASGSGSSALVFKYTVAAGQNIADLTSAASSAITLNGATIRGASGNNAVLTGANGYNPAGILQIDTTAPTLSAIAASPGSGQVATGGTVTLTATFSEAVTVAGGTPTLALNDGGTATYLSGSGSSALAFKYTVAAGQSTTDLKLAASNAVALNGGTIRDTAGNNAVLTSANGYVPAGTLAINPPAPPAATNDFLITPGSGTFKDAAGNAYSLDTSQNAIENAKDIPGGGGTSAMAYFNGTVLGQDAGGTGWYTWNQTNWQPDAPTVSDATSAGTLTKNLSQTGTFAENGDNFVLSSGNALKATLGSGNDNVGFIGPQQVALTGGSGAATVLAAGGNNTFTAGSGSLDVTAGAGKDAYVFHTTSGLLTLEDFSLAKGDTLTVDKSLQGSLHEASDAKGGTMLTFGTNTSHGVDIHGLAALPSSNVVWA